MLRRHILNPNTQEKGKIRHRGKRKKNKREKRIKLVALFEKRKTHDAKIKKKDKKQKLIENHFKFKFSVKIFRSLFNDEPFSKSRKHYSNGYHIQS